MYSTDSPRHRANVAARKAEDERKRAAAKEAMTRIHYCVPRDMPVFGSEQ